MFPDSEDALRTSYGRELRDYESSDTPFFERHFVWHSFKRYVKPGCKTRAVGVYMLSRTQEWGMLSAREIVI